MASRSTRSHIPLPLAPRMESLPTTDGSSDEHTDPWIAVSHPLLFDPSVPIRHNRNVSEAKSDGWYSTTAFGAKSVELAAPGKSNISSKDRVAQVQAHGRSRSQADLLPARSGGYKPKDKAKENTKGAEKKLPKASSKGSLSRRASAPLLGSFKAKKRAQVKPIDTSSRSYVRPGITPTSSRPTSPVAQLSTFGTVYVPPVNSSRAEIDIPRPSTAPLPNFHFHDLAPTSPSEQATDDEAVGGVHYSTYGSRVSQVYGQTPFSSILPPDTPFSSVIPVPASLLNQSETKTIHKRSSSQTLNAFLRRGKNGRADSPGPDESLASPENPRSPTSTIMEPSPTQPSTPGLPGVRPTTPAVPDFLVSSRTEGDDSPDSTPAATTVLRPRLRTRSSLLALAASVSGSGSGTGTGPRSPDSSRADSNATQRPRSVLARLASHFALPSSSGPQDESFPHQDHTETGDESLSSWQDESFTSGSGPDESFTNGGEFGVLPDLGELEPFSTMVQGSLSTDEKPVPTSSEESAPIAPPRPRLRTLSKLSETSRRMFSKVDRPVSATFSGRSSSRRRTLSVFSNASMSSRKPRSTRGREDGKRLDSVTRRASADAFSAEGSVEGTVMYGVGEEMLRLMFGGALPPPEAQQAPATHGQTSPAPEQAPTSIPRERERERTRSLPRRVSAPKPRVDRAAMLTPPSHEAQLLPDFGGSLDLRFSNPAGMTLPASNSNQSIAPNQNQARKKGHRRGAGSKSKENVSVGTTVPATRAIKSRSRSKSAPLGVSAELQTSLVNPKPPMGILTNGKRSPSPGPGRVVIVNSVVTPSLGSAGAALGGRERRRQTTRSNPMPVASGSSAEGTPDTSLSVDAQPGIIITAATPPAPLRSMTAPLDGSLSRASGAEVARAEGSESTRATVSRGTSVQFAPESTDGPRRARLRREASSGIASTLGMSEGSVHGKGKRKVEKEGPDVPEPGLSSPLKKQRLSEEEMDVTFMGEPLFGGVPQRSRSGHGSLDASSYYSGRSYPNANPRHSYPNQYSNSHPYPSPAASPEPERSNIPMRAIVTPRVQSLHGHGSDYASRRQSIGSIKRPMSRASARSNVTGGRSNGTGARSMTSSARRNRSWKDRLPLQGWCFILGFFMPFIWWYAAFSRAERGYYGGGVWNRDVETQWEGVKTTDRDNGRIDAHTWRFRCRLMAAFSLVIYVPVIVLAAVFAR